MTSDRFTGSGDKTECITTTAFFGGELVDLGVFM